MGKDTGMKMKMLEDQAEYYDYLDDEVWVYLYRFNMVLFWHQFLQRRTHNIGTHIKLVVVVLIHK